MRAKELPVERSSSFNEIILPPGESDQTGCGTHYNLHVGKSKPEGACDVANSVTISGTLAGRSVVCVWVIFVEFRHQNAPLAKTNCKRKRNRIANVCSECLATGRYV